MNFRLFEFPRLQITAKDFLKRGNGLRRAGAGHGDRGCARRGEKRGLCIFAAGDAGQEEAEEGVAGGRCVDSVDFAGAHLEGGIALSAD